MSEATIFNCFKFLILFYVLVPQNGPIIFRNVAMTFTVFSSLCELDQRDIIAVTFDSITSSLRDLDLCTLGRAASCGANGYNAVCTTVLDIVPNVVRRKRQTGDELELTISVEAEVEPGEEEGVEIARRDVDDLASMIEEVARAGNLTMFIDGETLVSAVGVDSVPSEIMWQCGFGSLIIDDGCG